MQQVQGWASGSVQRARVQRSMLEGAATSVVPVFDGPHSGRLLFVGHALTGPVRHRA